MEKVQTLGGCYVLCCIFLCKQLVSDNIYVVDVTAIIKEAFLISDLMKVGMAYTCIYIERLIVPINGGVRLKY